MFRKTLSFLCTKIGISLIVSIVIITSAFYFKDSEFFRGKPEQKAAITAEKEKVQQAFEKDTDGDGLKDWEEVLYGTDSNNPDTKGTGLGDAAEIEKLRTEAAEGTPSGSATSSQPTATDLFSREIFIKYVEAKRAGTDITPELGKIIADEVLSQKYEEEIAPFDESKLITVETKDPSFIRSYGNIVGAIVSAPLPENTDNELFILERITARESTSAQDKADLEKLLARYTKMRDSLVAVRIPADAKDAHAQIIQGIEIVMGVVVGIQKLETDPISSLPKVALYEDGADLLSAGSLRLMQYFPKMGVTFSPHEAGFVFMQ